ncbi:sensor histidine kinase [Propionibacteriaceae bacterium Y1685]
MTTSPQAHRRRSARLIDGVFAVAVAGVLSILIALSASDIGTGPHLPAHLFALGFGAILLLRHQLPGTVLVLSMLGTFAYYTLGYPPIGVALPVVGALYSAAEVGRLRWSILTGSVVFAVSLAFRLRDDPMSFGHLVGTDAVTNLALIAAAIALGYGVHTRRRHLSQQAVVAQLIQEQSVRESEDRAREERERLSRELHDTVGHSLSVIALQAGVASEAVGTDDKAVSTALDHVRQQSSASLHELRSMVRLLRTGEEDQSRRPHSLADLDAVVAQTVAAGVQVHTELDLAGVELPVAVDTAAYRIVQESLTNVLRHARATTARVRLAIIGDNLQITISDDGRGAPDRTDGHGLIGMTERVRLLGGTVVTQSVPGQGFTVEATIPTRMEP